MAKHLRIAIEGVAEPVSAIFCLPPKARAVLVLAHGAGAGMTHPWLEALSEALNERAIATLRYQFPYMEQGLKRTDSPAVATQAVAAAVQMAVKHAPKLPIFAGGKSFGARMTTTAAANGLLPQIRGIVCFGFPLHLAKQPAVTRAAHLAEVRVPTLFLQGTRDALADLELLEKCLAPHRRYLKLQIIDGADHGFAVLKSSGRTAGEVMAELADAASAFCLS